MNVKPRGFLKIPERCYPDKDALAGICLPLYLCPKALVWCKRKQASTAVIVGMSLISQ